MASHHDKKESQNNMKSPLYCPISLELMTDPVLAPDGHTYQRKEIVAWLQQNGTSPQTRQRISVESLVPNRAIRDLIEQERQLRSSVGTNDGNSSNSPSVAHSTVPPVPSTANNNDGKKHDKKVITGKPCTKTMWNSIKNATKATVHLNTHNKAQSVIHIDTPNFMDANSTSHHICCVIDISGSMAASAVSKDENGLEIQTGLTILDIVKFATLVISKSLEPKDKLSIITFSDNAQIRLEPTLMNDEGKKTVESILSQINPENMTNLWDGMKTGISLAKSVGKNYINSIFVLTDGIPNINPALGYERSLKNLLKK